MIPKNIIQIYLGDYGDESEYLFYLSEAWAALSGWDHKVYKNNEVDEIVRAYSEEAYVAYQSIPSLSYRCDLARLILVYQLGGMYLDLDTRPNSDIDLYSHFFINEQTKWGFCFSFLYDNVDAEGRSHNYKYVTMNHIFIAEKGSVLLKKIIDSMVDALLQKVNGNNNTTYPDIVSTMAWAEYVKAAADETLGADYREYHFKKGYGPFGDFWIANNNDTIKIKKFRNGISHVGSIILKDFLDTNANDHSFKDIAELYSDVVLHNGEIKIYVKGGSNGFPVARH